MAKPGFLAMRADLVDRGLLDGEHRLTPAGVAHVDRLIDQLCAAEAPLEPTKPRVRWNFRRASHVRRERVEAGNDDA